MAARKTGFRPYMSPSFPYIGVDTVDASRYAVTTHERWFSPPRSPTIVGSAVATIVWSSAARNMPSMSAAKIMRTEAVRGAVASTAADVILALRSRAPAARS